MRISLYKKILALFGGTLILVAAAVLFFSGRNVDRTVFDTELKGAENIMRLVNLNLEGQFKSYLTWKVEIVASYKQSLEEQSSIIRSGVERIAAGRKDKAARAVVLDWLTQVAAKPGRLVFAYNGTGALLAVGGDTYTGGSLDGLHDFKGREVAAAMRQEADRYGGGYSTFIWPDKSGSEERYLGYFAPLERFGWTLAVCENLSNMAQQVKQRQEEIIKGLGETMPDITVADSGPLFLFDSKGTMLVDPPQSLQQTVGLPEADRGELLERLVMAATKHNSESGHGPAIEEFGQTSNSVVFVSHFRPLDWYVAAAAPRSELRAPAVTLMERLSLVMAVALAVGLLIAVAVSRHIVGPLRSLTSHVEDLPERDWTSVNADKDELAVLQKLAGRHRDEVGALAEAFLYMDKELRRSIMELMDTVAEKNRIESELGVAREIQMGLLPKIFPPFPECEDVDLYAVLEPAREVGGDLYDFFFVDDKTLCVVVGDVSDKGVPAALFMTIAKTLVKNEALAGREPEEILLHANDDLSRDNPNAMFVTIFVGLLDVTTGELRFASGGHNPPLVLPASGADPYFLREVSGPMVGAMPGMDFDGLRAKLEKGDMLVVYTDGITEAMNMERKMFDEDGLFAVAESLRDGSAKEVSMGIVAATHEHAGEAPQSDDITILTVRLGGEG